MRAPPHGQKLDRRPVFRDQIGYSRRKSNNESRAGHGFRDRIAQGSSGPGRRTNVPAFERATILIVVWISFSLAIGTAAFVWQCLSEPAPEPLASTAGVHASRSNASEPEVQAEEPVPLQARRLARFRREYPELERLYPPSDFGSPMMRQAEMESDLCRSSGDDP
jgi:hypothetical protein